MKRFIAIGSLVLLSVGFVMGDAVDQIMPRDPLPEDFEQNYPGDNDKVATTLPEIEGWVFWWEQPDAGDKHLINYHTAELADLWSWWVQIENKHLMDENAPHPNYDFIQNRAEDLADAISAIDTMLYMDLVGADAWHQKSKTHAENSRADFNAGNAAYILAHHINTPPSQVDGLLALAYENWEASWSQNRLSSNALDDRIEVQNTIHEKINEAYNIEAEIFNAYWTY